MKNVTFLGVEGSGKTVLTTSLVNVFKAHEKEGWYLRPDSREAFRFLEQAPTSLEGESLPHQTTSLKRLAWSVQYENKTVRTFDVLDYPGEIYRLAFLEAKDSEDPNAFAERVASNKEDIDAVLGHLMESDHVFVLFNLADAENISRNSANLDAVWVTNACLDYLHRLPNHPTVTLLLTQIDRYVDMSKFELDPDVYVAHHLPLIHRNFSGLDVLAVSAIGPASATYGIDSIILRCLFECESVQEIVQSVRGFSKIVRNWFETFELPRGLVTCLDKLESINSSIDTCASEALRIPWFIPLHQLGKNGFVVDQDEINDERALLSLLRPINLRAHNETLIEDLRNAEMNFEGLETSSEIGESFRSRIISEVQKAIGFCCQDIEDAIKLRKLANTWIGIVGGVIVVEILVTLIRMLY